MKLDNHWVCAIAVRLFLHAVERSPSNRIAEVVNMSRYLIIFAPQIVLSLPLFIVYTGAIIGCLRARSTAPCASNIALWGVVVLLVGLLLRCVLMTWVMVDRPGGNPTGMSLPLVIVNIGHSVVQAIGFAMVVYAVFVGRPPVTQTS